MKTHHSLVITQWKRSKDKVQPIINTCSSFAPSPHTVNVLTLRKVPKAHMKISSYVNWDLTTEHEAEWGDKTWLQCSPLCAECYYKALLRVDQIYTKSTL